MKNFKGLSVLGLLAVSGSAFAHSEDASLFNSNEQRFVEVAPGVEKWLSGKELHQLSLRAHAEGRCGGFIDVTDFPKNEMNFSALIDFDRLAFTQQAAVEPMLGKVNAADLVARVVKLSSYRNRYYKSDTGKEAAEYIRDQYRALAGSRSDISVELFAHTFKQPSVIATIAGTGPQKDEVVIIGGHIDSINQRAIFNPGSAEAPGADDNASGTATVLEVFRIFVESGLRPNRTIQFMGYAGEELGLLGSADIAKDYQTKARAVAAVLQFDMTMFPGNDPLIGFMTDYTDAPLTRYTQRLVDTYVKFKWKSDKCGYGCSDHASWNRAGYPAVMPFETTMGGMNPAIHTPNDVIGNLSGDHGAHFVKLGLAYVTELSMAQ